MGTILTEILTAVFAIICLAIVAFVGIVVGSIVLLLPVLFWAMIGHIVGGLFPSYFASLIHALNMPNLEAWMVGAIVGLGIIITRGARTVSQAKT